MTTCAKCRANRLMTGIIVSPRGTASAPPGQKSRCGSVTISTSRSPGELFTVSAPQNRFRRIDRAAVIAQTGHPVGGEQQWCVEINDLGLLRDEQRRCHRKRCADHAADHDYETTLPRGGGERQRFGQPAGFVELDIDGVVLADETVDISCRVTGLVGAD